MHLRTWDLRESEMYPFVNRIAVESYEKARLTGMKVSVKEKHQDRVKIAEGLLRDIERQLKVQQLRDPDDKEFMGMMRAIDYLREAANSL